MRTGSAKPFSASSAPSSSHTMKFGGVMLAYEVHIRSRNAKILPGLVPHIGVKLKATFLLFSPRPDMLLEGKVVKLGKESIHVIVLGFCSASIMLEDIREEFNYTIKDGAGVFSSRSHKRHRIKVGSMIRFSVKSLDEEILHICGSLIPPHTGCNHWLHKHGVEALSDHSNKLEEKPRHGLEAPSVLAAQSEERPKHVEGQWTDRSLKRQRERNIKRKCKINFQAYQTRVINQSVKAYHASPGKGLLEGSNF